MNVNDLKYLFNLPPEKIIEWYKNKGLVLNWDWNETWQDAHARSFTVAKVMKLDILQDVHNAMIERFEKGTTFRKFQRKLEPILRSKGWWGKVKAKDVPGYDPNSNVDPEKIVQLGSPYRLKKIFRINSNVAYNSERYNFQMEDAVNRPYWQYVQVMRETKRTSHNKFHLLVFHYADPIWDILYPPNDWNCGCRVRTLSAAEVEKQKLTISVGSDYLEYAQSIIPEEWRYNPGKTAFQVDLGKYDSKIAKQYGET